MLKGQAISPGYALGKSFCLKPFQLDSFASRQIPQEDLETEVSKFKNALQMSKNEINQLVNLPQIKSSLDIGNIFRAHLALIEDPDLHKEVEKRIREDKLNVEFVVSKVIKDYSEFFKRLPDSQFQEKAVDIMDIGRRILKNFQGNHPLRDLPESKDGFIIIAEEISPSDIVGFEGINILGIATSEGTPTSHASILARSLGIPALIQVKNLLNEVSPGSFVIIDGNAGALVCDPLPEVIADYNRAHVDFENKKKYLQETLQRFAITTDGIRIKLFANIGQTQDVDGVLKHEADGIGLYRTELTYLIRKRFPSEKELTDIYWSVVQRINGSEIVIRTIDLGGDKISHLVGNPNEKNPELGWRAVRMSLDRLDIFRTQLRAILKTASRSPHGNVKILFPMISNLGEIRRSKEFLTEVKNELISEGVQVPENLKIGAMIEIPSAAILSERIAREVDFLSIGSNDLVQYTLAVDRTNSKVAHLYQPTNPAVLKLLRDVVLSGEKWNKSVSICGELAGDWRYTVLLLGLGLKELSMNPIFIPKVKRIVQLLSFSEVQKRVLPLLDLDTSEEIESAIKDLNVELKLE